MCAPLQESRGGRPVREDEVVRALWRLREELLESTVAVERDYAGVLSTTTHLSSSTVSDSCYQTHLNTGAKSLLLISLHQLLIVMSLYLCNPLLFTGVIHLCFCVCNKYCCTHKCSCFAVR